MGANNLVIFHPDNNEQMAALKSLGKILKMNFEVTTQEKFEKRTRPNKEKKQVLGELKQAVKELNLIKKGKLQGRNAQDFLDEL